jgi:RNA exonuclease 4
VFGQDHVAKVLLGWETGPGAGSHDAVKDAIKSMRLFNYYHQLQATPGAWEGAQRVLMDTQPEPSFARLNPVYEGVCMGNRKTCSCGAPFFS